MTLERVQKGNQLLEEMETVNKALEYLQQDFCSIHATKQSTIFPIDREIKYLLLDHYKKKLNIIKRTFEDL